MAELNGSQQQLKDTIDDAATRLGIPLHEAPNTLWRLANYGGHANTVPSSAARAELDSALAQAKAAGVWIRYDADLEAEAVTLSEWRDQTPAVTLFRALTVERDRWSSAPTDEVRVGPIHAREGAGINVAPTSLCARGVIADESQGRIRTVDLPNADDDWCITCEQRVAQLLGG